MLDRPGHIRGGVEDAHWSGGDQLASTVGKKRGANYSRRRAGSRLSRSSRRMRPYPLSGRKFDAVATTGAIFCSSRVTIGAVESGLRIRGRSNWVLLASRASNGGIGEALKWVRRTVGQTGRSRTGSLLVPGPR